jgi:WhiB family redox-sensing transcriptional regulator
MVTPHRDVDHLVLEDHRPTIDLRRPSWMRDAACLEHPEVKWIEAELSDKRTTEAVAICSACLVRRQCLGYALADPTLVGVWGATTSLERRALRREALP